MKYCLNCNSEIPKRNKYCSNTCQAKYEYKVYMEKWKNGEVDGNTGKNKELLSQNIIKYIKNKFDNKCCECGWNEINKFTGKVPLEIDHIDGDYKNSVEENLKPLCPSCHSLTEFYGGRNKGRGRSHRR